GGRAALVGRGAGAQYWEDWMACSASRSATGAWRMALLAAGATAALGAAPALAKDIKVCLIAGKTGPLEAYAKQTENGFMMGLEYLTKNTMKLSDARGACQG